MPGVRLPRWQATAKPLRTQRHWAADRPNACWLTELQAYDEPSYRPQAGRVLRASCEERSPFRIAQTGPLLKVACVSASPKKIQRSMNLFKIASSSRTRMQRTVRQLAKRALSALRDFSWHSSNQDRDFSEDALGEFEREFRRERPCAVFLVTS